MIDACPKCGVEHYCMTSTLGGANFKCSKCGHYWVTSWEVTICSHPVESEPTHTVHYGSETTQLTPRFVRALKELMAAECEMFSKLYPEDAEDWQGGVCRIGNMGSSSALEFEYGTGVGFYIEVKDEHSD